MQSIRSQILLTSLLFVAVAPLSQADDPGLDLSTIDGFTEPYREIDLPAAESGTIRKVFIEEGDRVTANQILVAMDDQILQASLAIADSARQATGKLLAARVDLELHTKRLEKLQQLLERQHASQEEVERTEAQLQAAEAQLLTVREDLEIRSLEYQRILAQIERRKIRSTIDGVVQRVYKDSGEFVAPNDPVVVKVVQLDPLLIIFSVPSAAVRDLELRKEQSVKLAIGPSQLSATGTIEFIAPTTDPQSGTVRVKVRLPNDDGRWPGGETCRLLLPGFDRPEQLTRKSESGRQRN